MARPRRCRRVCAEPVYGSFCPAGNAANGEVMLTLDEYEAIRLIDLEKLTHAQCAVQMDISRTTVTEIYELARTKLADVIVNGKSLFIAGGDYRLCDGSALASGCCHQRCRKFYAGSESLLCQEKGEKAMRIAVTYDNGQIFQHFGHSSQFKVYDVEDGRIAVVRIGEEYSLKRIFRGEDYLELRSENPKYHPIIIRGEQENAEIVGKAVQFLSRVI